MTRRCPEVRRGLDRAGFTLIEIVIALMISGLVVTSIFQIMQGNSRFVRMQSAREEVQQNARAALELIASDLRAVPPHALITMEPTRVRFRQPRAWGILCNKLKPASPAAWALFPAGVMPADSFFNRPAWGIAVVQTTDPLVNTGVYRFVPGPTRVTYGDPCGSIQTATSAQRVRLGFVTPGNPFVTSDSILPGTPVMLYEEVQYDVATPGGAVPGQWIRRMTGYSGSSPNMQPMAGPVPAGGGLRFTYLQADGTTPAVLPSDVRQIGIEVTTRSSAVFNQGGLVQPQQVDSARTDVYLRNIPG
jgi:prepilin-type N-terminal cleavage/methylation domain-containing protein